MDVRLLESRGVKPSSVRTAFVDGFKLRIGERATLVQGANDRAFGTLMNVTSIELAQLYSEDSVADYVPEIVSVELADGSKVEAACYNLPGDKVTGTNKEYAKSLLKLADELGFPDSYLDEIRRVMRGRHLG